MRADGSKKRKRLSCIARRLVQAGWLVCLVGVLTLVACQKGLYHAEYHDLTSSGWDSRDTLVFELPATAHDQALGLTVSVRSTSRFGYCEVATQVEVLCDGQVTAVMPISVPMCEAAGHPLGGGVMMRTHMSEPEPLHLKAGHHYTLRLTHRMRLNPLEEVLAVGVVLENR